MVRNCGMVLSYELTASSVGLDKRGVEFLPALKWASRTMGLQLPAGGCVEGRTWAG